MLARETEEKACYDDILGAIANYIEPRKTSRHNNQHKQAKELDTIIRTLSPFDSS